MDARARASFPLTCSAAARAECGCASRARSGARRRWPRSPAVLRLRGREAPVDVDFRTWAASHTDERTAAMLLGGLRRLHLPPRSRRAVGRVRLAAGGAAAADGCRRPCAIRSAAGARSSPRSSAACASSAWTSQTGSRVDELPEPPVILATELEQARELLGDESLRWKSGQHRLHRPRPAPPPRRPGRRLRHGRGRLDRALLDDQPSIAPDGEELIQAQMPIRPQRERRAGRAAPGAAARRSVSRTGASARPGAGAR